MGRAAFGRGEHAMAADHLEKAANRAGTYADVHNLLGLSYHALGQFGRAREAFERALAVNPRYTEAALNLAVTCNDMGRYQEAQDAFERARAAAGPGADLDPFAKGKIANMYVAIGDTFATMGLPLQAAEEYERALKLCPHYPDVRVKRASALRDAGRHEEGLAELTDALATAPEFHTARVQLGVTLYSAGRHDEARAAWQDVLRRDPKNRGAEMYLRLAKPA